MVQPTRLGLGPCGLGPKKPTLKKNHQRSPQSQKYYKTLWVRVNPWTFIFNMKNILLSVRQVQQTGQARRPE